MRSNMIGIIIGASASVPFIIVMSIVVVHCVGVPVHTL